MLIGQQNQSLAKNLILVASGFLIKSAEVEDHSSNVQFCASLTEKSKETRQTPV